MDPSYTVEYNSLNMMFCIAVSMCNPKGRRSNGTRRLATKTFNI